MLTIKTGVPGSGKTLTAVCELLDAYEAGKWKLQFDPAGKPFIERIEGECRVLFTHGIPDLKIPAIPLPVSSPIDLRRRDDVRAPHSALEVDWSMVPDGALVIIDEAQKVFPVRAAGSTVPGYVAFLNTHRHRGIDIVLITQHPKLIDGSVRKLCGKHQHYRRVLGGQRHVSYEWDHCSESLGGTKQATVRVSAFPKRAYSAYKSSEIHTKQEFAIPTFVVVPIAALVLMVFVGPTAWRVVNGIASGQGVGSASAAASAPKASSAPGVKSGQPMPADELMRRRLTGISGAVPVAVAASSAYRDIWAPSHWPPSIGGCWIQGDECLCITNGARARLVTDGGAMCAQVARGELDPDPSRPKPSPQESKALQSVHFADGSPSPVPTSQQVSQAKPPG